MNIPNDLTILLSGVPCVGKTTTAYNLIKKYPAFRRVSELDIIRTVIRSVIKNLETKNVLSHEDLQSNYSALFEALSEQDLSVSIEQSKLLLPYIADIVRRQQYRRMPSIIEGSCIVPSTFFDQGNPKPGFENNVYFINLYLSNIEEHIARRIERCAERKKYEETTASREKIIRIRNTKNLQLHEDTLNLSMINNKVYSFDISHMSQNEVIENIIKIVSHD